MKRKYNSDKDDVDIIMNNKPRIIIQAIPRKKEVKEIKKEKKQKEYCSYII